MKVKGRINVMKEKVVGQVYGKRGFTAMEQCSGSSFQMRVLVIKQVVYTYNTF
jgi:hypothetical protein